MNRFAALIDALAFEPRRNGKLELMRSFFASTPDPERGYALAALTGNLSFQNAKSGLIRTLIIERVDPLLFALSYDYVGDLSETVALLWPQQTKVINQADTPLSVIIEKLYTLKKSELPAQVTRWLDNLDETGRWALLKLITGSLRIGVSARLAKTAVALLGNIDPDEIETIWHGLKAPYTELFAWVNGEAEKPLSSDPTPFRPMMLAHPLEESDCDKLNPDQFVAEWKWDGIRIQAVSNHADNGQRITRLYSRTGEDISAGFPDLVENINFNGAIDGELLVMREGHVQSFNVLQQRLNRKVVTQKLLDEYPAHIRAYDILQDGVEDVRGLPFFERRQKLIAILADQPSSRLDISELVPFASFEELTLIRANPEGQDAEAIEGCMLKLKSSAYLTGRPRGFWFKWKREPMVADCVMMYAQRGHGKRSSFYSDFTFGVWRPKIEGGTELVPVGKAYFGFTDQELVELDRFVRKSEGQRFGPVREVKLTQTPDGRPQGLVLEIAFEGLQKSTRHKSGIAMRFPRISRIRWDKPADEADQLETLENMLSKKISSDVS